MRPSQLHKHVWVSIVAAFCLIIADYFVANMKYPIFDDSASLSKLGHFFMYDNDSNDLFTVNVAYDKELATVVDIFGDTIGNSPVTDREKLCRFLDVMSESNYKYAFIDIRFEAGMYTPFDSALFERIIRMPRLVISNHDGSDGYEIADHRLIPKSAFADYNTTLNASFSRYRFLQQDEPSVALHLYREINHKNIKRHSFIYTDGGRLCYNTQFLPLLDRDILLMRHQYLGSELLERTPIDTLKKLMDNKIVLIGDFENDTHSTYIGEVPGPLLNYYAFKLLEQGGHKVNLLCYGIIFISFWLICLIILRDKPIFKFKSPIVKTLISLIGWDFILYLLQMSIYIIFRQSFSFIIPGIVFSLIILIINIKASLKCQETTL